jgi:hypothetical protein
MGFPDWSGARAYLLYRAENYQNLNPFRAIAFIGQKHPVRISG